MAMTTRKLVDFEDELHERASHITTLDNFGDSTYRQGLRVLLKAYDTDMQLTKAGIQGVCGAVVANLIARLYAQRGWDDHPEVLATTVREPLIITGLPRTGTTALHKLLSVDPQFQGLEYWLVKTPMTRPPREMWRMYPTYRALIAELEASYSVHPEFLKVHELAADEVEECWDILSQSFVFGGFCPQLPTYDRWFQKQSMRETYLRYANVVRLIGAHEQQKRWLLKCPFHLGQIDTLIEVFPDACIIQTHRDPLETIPSNCSAIHMGQRAWQGDNARPEIIGPQECNYWHAALNRAQSARQKSTARFFDVDHRALLTDPLNVVRAIYEQFDLTFLPNVEKQLHARITANPTARHGKHQYTTDSFGITKAQICETFAEYRRQRQFD